MKAIELFRPPPLAVGPSVGLLLLRLVTGLAFAFHGWGKIRNPFGWMGEDFSVPAVFQVLAAVSEFGGGLAWMLGFLTPLASFGLACTMAVAVYVHAVVFGDPFAHTGEGGAYEAASVYFCIALLLILAGPGRFSLDRLVFGERTPMAPGGMATG
jgi:putative oxidoreductase